MTPPMQAHEWTSIIYVVTMIVVMVSVVWMSAHDMRLRADAQAECARRKGHVVRVYRSWMCVSADGRIIELKPRGCCP